jgi:hypothetical protein
MSFERQPGRLATINLRKQLDVMMKTSEAAKQKPTKGLLTPQKPTLEKQDENVTETQRVLNYMEAIRKSMTTV